MKKVSLALALLVLLVSQPAEAVSSPISISYGRSWPMSIAVDSARGLIYVDSTSGENPPVGFTFGVVNATSRSLLRAFPLHEFPGPIAFDQATGEVFVAGAGNDTIEIFNATNAIGALGTSGHQILGMTYDRSVSPDIFFTSGDGVFALDPGSSELVLSATVPGGPFWPVLDPANGMLYVSEYLSGEIAVLSASTLAPVSTIKLPSCCASEMAVNPKTQALYASTGTNVVDMVNVATGEFERSITVTGSPQNSTGPIALDAVNNRVYVGSSPGGSILELDGATGAVVGTFLVQSQVAGLAIDTDAQELYATNYHQISVFDTKGAGSSQLLVVWATAAIAVAAVAVYALWRRGGRDRLKVQAGGRVGE